MSSFSGPEIVSDGLVLSLDAANTRSYPGSGTTWTDLSGRGNNGTLTNGPTYSSSNGGSIVFDGSNDYILSPLNLNYSQGTISVWVYPTQASNNSFFVYTANNPNINWSHQLGINGGNNLSSYLFDGTGKYAIGNTFLSLNRWYNFNLVWLNNSYCRSYINGNLETTFSIGTAWAAGTNFWIGSSTGGGSGILPTSFKGNMGALTVHNRSLTEEEIKQNFQALRGRFNI